MTINGRPALTPVPASAAAIMREERAAVPILPVPPAVEPDPVPKAEELPGYDPGYAAYWNLVRADLQKGMAAQEAKRQLAQIAAKGRGGLRTYTAGQLADLPAPEPLIHRWLYRDTDARIYGASTHGKTFLATGIALSVATGRSWCGNEVRPGRVLYLAAEDPAGVALRARAWQAHHGLAAEDQFVLVDGAIQLGAPDDLVELARELQPTLVVIDTQHRATAGMEENSASDAARMLDALRRIREAGAPGCSTLLVHHTGHDGTRARGSSSAFAALDVELQVSRDEDGVITIKCVKTKNGESGRTHELELVAVESVLNADGDAAAVAVMPDPLGGTERRTGGAAAPILPVVPGLPTTQGAGEAYDVLRDQATVGTGLTKAEVVAEMKVRYIERLSAREKQDKATLEKTRARARTDGNRAWAALRESGWIEPADDEKAGDTLGRTQSVRHRALSPAEWTRTHGGGGASVPPGLVGLPTPDPSFTS